MRSGWRRPRPADDQALQLLERRGKLAERHLDAVGEILGRLGGLIELLLEGAERRDNIDRDGGDIRDQIPPAPRNCAELGCGVATDFTTASSGRRRRWLSEAKLNCSARSEHYRL
jgi:hypothetical protein